MPSLLHSPPSRESWRKKGQKGEEEGGGGREIFEEAKSKSQVGRKEEGISEVGGGGTQSLTPFPCLPLLEKVGEMQSIMFALGGPSDTKVICPTPLLLLVRLLVPKKSGGGM